jgi:hypothetical protein
MTVLQRGEEHAQASLFVLDLADPHDVVRRLRDAGTNSNPRASSRRGSAHNRTDDCACSHKGR